MAIPEQNSFLMKRNTYINRSTAFLQRFEKLSSASSEVLLA
jgi:hypothetical protein